MKAPRLRWIRFGIEIATGDRVKVVINFWRWSRTFG